MPETKDLAKPTQVVLASLRNQKKDNIMALCWHMPVSFNPPIYAISIAHIHLSNRMVRESGVFCVNFMPAELEEKLLFCGTRSGNKVDKFARAGLEKGECESIDCPFIKQAFGRLECKVIDTVETGDHTVFIGGVEHAAGEAGGKRLFQTVDGFKAL